MFTPSAVLPNRLTPIRIGLTQFSYSLSLEGEG